MLQTPNPQTTDFLCHRAYASHIRTLPATVPPGLPATRLEESSSPPMECMTKGLLISAANRTTLVTMHHVFDGELTATREIRGRM